MEDVAIDDVDVEDGPQRHWENVIVFVNAKSGGQKGKNLMKPLTATFGEGRVYNLFDSSPPGPRDG